MKSPPTDGSTHHQLELVHVLRLGIAVLNLLGHQKTYVEQEQTSLSAFLYQLLRIPNCEVILQQDFAKSVQYALHRSTSHTINEQAQP